MFIYLSKYYPPQGKKHSIRKLTQFLRYGIQFLSRDSSTESNGKLTLSTRHYRVARELRTSHQFHVKNNQQLLISNSFSLVVVYQEHYSRTINYFPINNSIGGVLGSVLASSAVDLRSSPGRIIPKTIKLVCVAFPLSTQQIKRKDWLARNQNNVSEWSIVSSCELLFQ